MRMIKSKVWGVAARKSKMNPININALPALVKITNFIAAYSSIRTTPYSNEQEHRDKNNFPKNEEENQIERNKNTKQP